MRKYLRDYMEGFNDDIFFLPKQIVFEEIDKVAYKYAAKTFSLEPEDLIQKILIFLYEKNPADLALLRRMLKNFIIDQCRANSREAGGIFDTDMNDQYEDIRISYSIPNTTPEEQIVGEMTAKDLIDSLGDVSKSYAVAKAYLSGEVPELYDEFMICLSNLDEDTRIEIMEYTKDPNKRITDDYILKKISKVKTGSNSCKARVIKTEIDEAASRLGLQGKKNKKSLVAVSI